MQALIVDDSSTMRKVLKSILTGAGFEVTEAKCGADALACLKQQPADLALFDWNMPEMTGIELLGKVRSDPSYNAMKIMMVTTESELSELERALREGADEYVMKPFTRDSILNKLNILGCIQ
jgi:two-component system chemotaxis response regulator CheY